MKQSWLSRFFTKSVSTAALIPPGSRQVQFQDWDAEKAITEGYKSSTWVYVCINLRMKSVASVPWRVEQRMNGEWVDSPNHPLQAILTQPNPEMDFNELMRLSMSQLDLAGNTYWIKARAGDDNTGKLVFLYPVPKPYRMQVKSGDAFTKALYRYDDGGKRVDFQPENIVHFAYTNPDNMLFGMSPLQAGSRCVDIDVQAARFQHISMGNRGVPDGIISMKDDAPTMDKFEQMREIVKKQYTGASNARVPWIMFNGQWQQMSLSAAELDFINSRKFTREEICALYSVPPPMVGIYDNATLANIQTARQIFWHDTIIPLLDELSSHLNHALVPEFGRQSDLRIVYDTTNVQVLQENYSAKVDNAVKLFGIGVPLNEINRVLELNLPDIEGGETGYLGAGLIPMGFDFSSLGTDSMDAEKAAEMAYGVKRGEGNR